MKTKHTQGVWRQRELFANAILVIDEEDNREWYSNTISIHDNDNRIICDVHYRTDCKNQGWGHNNTVELYKGNANLIAAAPELLEACTELINLLSFHGYNNSSEIYKAQKAIAKAKGE
jgi:hypothetical protein